jgi:hypothetical protein
VSTLGITVAQVASTCSTFTFSIPAATFMRSTLTPSHWLLAGFLMFQGA